jgi:hypothetical protein
MKYCYPLNYNETNTYSHRIKDYRKLSTDDKRILVNNFKEFYKYIFWYQRLPHPTRDQLAMAKYVSQLRKSQEPIMMQCQRGLAKSLTVQILSVWLLLRNKNEVISVISATSARAESFITFCKTLLRDIPILKHLYPQGGDRSSSRKIDVNGRVPNDSPSLSAFGVTSAKTGSRSSLLIYDDVEIPENSDTAQKREKLLEGVRDSANLGIAGVFREICICTPQSAESVYNTMLEDGFSRYIIPAEYPDDITVYDGDLAKHIEWSIKRNPNIVGTATDKRNNMKHLLKQKMKGKARYKLHYMLDTALSDAEKYPLKLSDLIVTDLDNRKASLYYEYSTDKRDTLYDLKHKGFRGDYIRKPRVIGEERKDYEGIAMFIDPSGRGTDETAYCITATLAGKIFLLDFGGVSGGYEDSTLTQLANIAKEYKVNLVQIESNFGDGAFGELLKPYLRRIHNCMVEDLRATTQKEVRIIETLEPIVMQHRLIVNKRPLERDSEKKDDYSFTYQYTHITTQRGCLVHDDIIDVIGMGVSYWVLNMARDEKEEMMRYEDELIQKELDDFMLEFSLSSNSNNVMDNY